MELRDKLRHVMDFPVKGIDFIDITTVLQDADAMGECFLLMQDEISKIGDFELVVGPESRGFIFGVPIALVMKKGFVPIRKAGKLPYKIVSIDYEKEYGKDFFEIHADSIKPGQEVIIVDDLLATGGTTEANVKLIEKLGGVIKGIFVFVELEYLHGRDRLKDYYVNSIVRF